MNVPYHALALTAVAAGFSAALLGNAQAGGGHYFAPVTDPVVKEECGSCHIAYPADERDLNATFRVDTEEGAHNPITVANRPQREPETIMRTANLITATALAAGLAVGGFVSAPAFGQDAKPGARAEANARLSIAQVHERLSALGYKDIDEIERDRGVYEVEAATSTGERVKLYVDAGSGEILRTKSEARDRGGDSKRMGRQADRAAPDCTDRRCRDDRVQTIPSESMGWYLRDIYGRLKAAGV